MANQTQFKGLIFEIDCDNLTATVISSENAVGNILIPNSIYYDSQEFSVIFIKEGSFKNNQVIQSIDFPENSKLITIDKNAFQNSSLKALTIPASVQNLVDGWCNDTPCLSHINLSPQSKYFKYLDEDKKVVIGKTNKNDEEYDAIIFASRNIESVTIPSHIKEIKSYAFSKCDKLSTVDISKESSLFKIGQESFSNTPIETFTVPPTVTDIEEKAFSWCNDLKTVEMSKNSKLKKIVKNIFFESSVENFFIPASVEELEEGWCSDTWSLNHVTISPDNKHFKFFDENKQIIVGRKNIEINCFDELIFAARDIEKAIIPSFIRHICSFSFSWCKNLLEIEFEKDSELESIGESAFSDSSIVKISLPKSVKKIPFKTFWWCRNLVEIELPEDSELISIEKNAFTHSALRKLTIPSSVEELNDEWCNDTYYLFDVSLSSRNKCFKYLDNEKKIIVGKSSKTSQQFDILVFACRNIEAATIPSYIKRIDSHAFSNCAKIERFEISEDSELEYIGKCAFSYSSIVEFKVPKSVKQIQFRTFYRCKNLERVEIPESSELISIDDEVFVGTALQSLSIPSSVQELVDGWCNETPNLTHVCLSPHNKYLKYLDSEKKVIIGRTNKENDEYDSLIFGSRNVEEVVIPSFIKIIKSYAFSNCNKLNKVSISKESNLTTISSNSFSNTSISSIAIPSTVTVIETKSFSRCNNLRNVEISENSELQKINEYAFAYSDLQNISLPEKIKDISKGLFISCENIDSLEFLGDEIFFGKFCFNYCENILLISLPNARIIFFSKNSLYFMSNDFSLFTSHGAIIKPDC